MCLEILGVNPVVTTLIAATLLAAGLLHLEHVDEQLWMETGPGRLGAQPRRLPTTLIAPRRRRARCGRARWGARLRGAVRQSLEARVDWRRSAGPPVRDRQLAVDAGGAGEAQGAAAAPREDPDHGRPGPGWRRRVPAGPQPAPRRHLVEHGHARPAR